MTTPVSTRWITLQPHDTLPRVAWRELGNALRWAELAHINALRPPYISASLDPADRQPSTLLWGERLAVPIAHVTQTVQVIDDVLGLDVRLTAGQLSATATGDWAVTQGADTLSQALTHRLKTPRGDLWAHPTYGCDLPKLLGVRNTHVLQMLSIGWVRQALAQEPRVARVTAVQTAISGDQFILNAHVEAVDHNTAFDLNLVFPTG